MSKKVKATIRTIILSLIALGFILAIYNKIQNDKIQDKILEKELVLKFQFYLERSYFEGQKAAINGDIRISLDSDSVYVWTKSPWDNGMPPIYSPDKSDSRRVTLHK